MEYGGKSRFARSRTINIKINNEGGKQARLVCGNMMAVVKRFKRLATAMPKVGQMEMTVALISAGEMELSCKSSSNILNLQEI